MHETMLSICYPPQPEHGADACNPQPTCVIQPRELGVVQWLPRDTALREQFVDAGISISSGKDRSNISSDRQMTQETYPIYCTERKEQGLSIYRDGPRLRSKLKPRLRHVRLSLAKDTSAAGRITTQRPSPAQGEGLQVNRNHGADWAVG